MIAHAASPPPFLQLAGHPLRWGLLRELARSDRRVGELCELAGRPQSLVSYHLRQLRDGGRRFDYVVTLCHRVREVCPEFPGPPEAIHWSIPDPAREPGTDEETLPAFRRTAAELALRLGFFIHAIPQEVTERA